ncbi:MAG: ParA family protein [Acidimicrobiales bacterium]
MAVTVAVFNQKGGVGKTALTLGLASAARAQAHPTLVVDLDPQASATWTLGIDPEDSHPSVADVLSANRDGAAAPVISPSGWGEHVHGLPSAPTLAEREFDGGRARPEHRLRRALTGVTDAYRTVLIDCPPSLGLTARTALTAADYVLLVVEPSAYSNRGVAAVLDAIDEVWDRHNRDLDIAGVVVNRMPPTGNEARDRLAEVKSIMGARAVFAPPVPTRALINEALGDGRAIHDYGYRGRTVAAVFDQLYARLQRVIR